MPTVTMYGRPAPKGSLKCVGQHGRHQLVESVPPKQKVARAEWRKLIGRAGAAILAGNDGIPYSGPVEVRAVFTLPRPKSVPVSRRWWPHRKPTADIDKLLRMVLDGLADSGLLGDDVQVVMVTGAKVYPDTPIAGVPSLWTGQLGRAGVVITVRPLADETPPAVIDRSEQ